MFVYVDIKFYKKLVIVDVKRSSKCYIYIIDIDSKINVFVCFLYCFFYIYLLKCYN